MKLNPNEKSEYFDVRETDHGYWEEVFDKSDKRITCFSKMQGDSIEFFKTGFYIKIDQNYVPDGKKCFVHMFYNNDGVLILDLHDADIENGNGYSRAQFNGHFTIDVENNGLKISFEPYGTKLPAIEKRVLYDKLNTRLAINDSNFFDGEGGVPQKF